jgi:multidrug resistance efflux pump
VSCGVNRERGDFVKRESVARIDPTESQARVHQAQQQAESAKAQVTLAQHQFDNNSMVSRRYFQKLPGVVRHTLAGPKPAQAAQAAVDVLPQVPGFVYAPHRRSQVAQR